MDAVGWMRLFGNLTYVAIAIAAVGLIMAVIFFFVFNIRDVYALRTGKAKRVAIERMSARNEQTGRLRATTGSGSLKTTASIPSAVTDEQKPDASATADSTTLLNGSSSETTVLGTSDNETTVLTNQAPAPAAAQTVTQPVPKPSSIRFDISDDTVVIHTDEMI